MPKSPINKTPSVKAAASTTAAPSISQTVDELGRIQQEIRDLTPVFVIPEETKTKLKILAKQEAAAIEQLLSLAKPAAEKESIVEGGGFTALIGPAENKRTINVTNATLARVVDAECGKGTFLANCSITLTALDKLLPAAVAEKVINSARTGRRTVSTAAKGVMEKAA